MIGAVYAFIFQGEDGWQLSGADKWELDLIELDGTEKVLGHRRIDGSICKVLQTSEGKLVALTKQN